MRILSVAAWLAIVPAAALAAACGGAEPGTPAPAADGSSTDGVALIPILGTTALGTGAQRIAFLLESPTALVTEPSVEVRSSLPGDPSAEGESARAVFHGWPFGTRGSYVTELTFDRPGAWRLAIEVGGDAAGSTELLLDVAAETPVPEVGALAPFSDTKTVEDAQGDLAAITTYHRPDPDLYQVSIAESLFTGKPGVVVFASPAFCTSPTCGPQVDALAELKELYVDQADFIHVEVYDNPGEIRGDLGRAVYSPVLAEWGIDAAPDYRNESWTFVLARDGRITARYQGYATLDELEAALLDVL